MALVSNICQKVNIPHEEGQFMVLRKLSWKQLEQARDARQDVGVSKMRAMGGELLAALKGTNVTKEDLQKIQDDPLVEYDRSTLLRAGISSWSYDKPPSEGIDELDDQTADWAARSIVDLSKPKETPEERKNG